jgi:hypothetical protein
MVAAGLALLGGPALAETKEQLVPLAERTACPKQGAEALMAVSNILAKNHQPFDHVTLLCIAETLKAQEARLKALEAQVSKSSTSRPSLNGKE